MKDGIDTYSGGHDRDSILARFSTPLDVCGRDLSRLGIDVKFADTYTALDRGVAIWAHKIESWMMLQRI